MAKAAKKIVASVNVDLLKGIAIGTVNYVSQDEAVQAGLTNDPPLIEVNTDPSAIVNGKAPVRLTEAGKAWIMEAPAVAAPTASAFSLISNAVLPPSKRKGGGGNGAPKKYPFDQMEVGHSFFVAATAENADPVKKLGSTISAANMRFAEKTGETKQVERTVRGPGNKAVKNPDGTNKRETKTVDVYKQTRKFSIRPVVGGQKYGDWIAPSNGALIARVE
jgi:hypothetical protein